MIKLLTIILTLFLIGCSGQKEIKNESVTTETIDSLENTQNGLMEISARGINPDSLSMSAVLAVIHGIWSPKEYVNLLERTNSAFLAHDSIPLIAEFQINTSKFSGDTLGVVSSINNHEGYGFDLFFNQSKYAFIKTSAFAIDENNRIELRWDIALDTTLFMIEKDRDGNKVNSTSYVRVGANGLFSQYGGNSYDIATRMVMLNGDYVIKSTNDTISFNIDGSIDNFRKKYFTIQSDFGGPSYSGDNILLLNTEEDYENRELYIFESVNDTISLFEEIEDSVTYLPGKGNLIEELYKLN